MRDQLLLPIEYDPRRHGYYYTRPVENFPGVVVSESELFALLVARKAVAHYKGTPFYRPLQTAFEKLTTGLDPKVVLHLENLGEAMDIRVSGLEELRIAFRLDNLEEVEPWVLGWGAHATVARPKALADLVAAAATALLERYAAPAKPLDDNGLESVVKNLATMSRNTTNHSKSR